MLDLYRCSWDRLHQQKTYNDIKYTKAFPRHSRHKNHREFFNLDQYICGRELSSQIWKLIERNQSPVLTWKVLGKHSACNINRKKRYKRETENCCIQKK